MVNKYHGSRFEAGHKEHLLNVQSAVNQVRGAVNIIKGKGTMSDKVGKINSFYKKTKSVSAPGIGSAKRYKKGK